MIPPIVSVYQDSQIKRKMNVQKQHNMQAQVTCLLLFSQLKRMGIEDKKTSKGLFRNSLFS